MSQITATLGSMNYIANISLCSFLCCGVYLILQGLSIRNYPGQKSWISVWIFAGLVLYIGFIPAQWSCCLKMLGILILCEWFFLQDAKSLYFSLKWFIPGTILFLLTIFYSPVAVSWRIYGLFFAGLGLVFAIFRRMGWADVWFLALCGFGLGCKRMISCVLFACLFGIVWQCIGKKRMVPFVSCLAAGLVFSLLRGYILYELIWNIA